MRSHGANVEEITKRAQYERMATPVGGSSSAHNDGGNCPRVRVHLSIAPMLETMATAELDSFPQAKVLPGEPLPTPPRHDLASEWED